MPSLSTKQCRDPTIAITPKLAGEIDNGFGKRRFVVGYFGNMPLGRTGLAKNMTGSTFGNAKRLLDMMHTDPKTGGAQKFPDAASFRMSLSSVRSATALFSRAFSRSSSFKRFA